MSMASYHLSMQVISRADGRSAVASSAYRARERVRDERYDKTHDYSGRDDLTHAEIMTPEGAPAWMEDRAALWNGVEATEKRRDAQLARECEVALPRELSEAERVELVRGFVSKEFVSRGMVADFAIHTPRAADGGEQPHAHIMLTMRDIDGDGFGKKNREWNDAALLKSWRESWADHQNEALEAVGSGERVDHRSLADQRAEALEQGDQKRAAELDREPEIHRGAADGMAARGITTERLERWRDVLIANAQRVTERLRLSRRIEWLQEKASGLRQSLAEHAGDVKATKAERDDDPWAALAAGLKERDDKKQADAWSDVLGGLSDGIKEREAAKEAQRTAAAVRQAQRSNQAEME